MKIAIVSSGLGHVARGVETWARDTAAAVSEQGARSREHGEHIDVTLFPGAPCPTCHGIVPHARRRMPHALCGCQALPCLKRGSRAARFLAKAMPAFTWRWGWTSTYGIEQFTFAKSLIKELRRHPVDIVHTQDVIVAKMCQVTREALRRR